MKLTAIEMTSNRSPSSVQTCHTLVKHSRPTLQSHSITSPPHSTPNRKEEKPSAANADAKYSFAKRAVSFAVFVPITAIPRLALSAPPHQKKDHHRKFSSNLPLTLPSTPPVPLPLTPPLPLSPFPFPPPFPPPFHSSPPHTIPSISLIPRFH